MCKRRRALSPPLDGRGYHSDDGLILSLFQVDLKMVLRRMSGIECRFQDSKVNIDPEKMAGETFK